MKKYKSLIYRMWKTSSSKILLSALAYILTCSFMFLPFLFELIDDNPGELARTFEEIMNGGGLVSFQEGFGNFFFLLIPIFVGGCTIFASGIITSDQQVGWSRYAFTLPVTAGENARAYLMLHFLYFVGFEIIALIYGGLIGSLIHVSYFVGTAMNLVAIIFAVSGIKNTIENLIIVLLWEHKRIEQVLMVVGFCLGCIVFICFFGLGNKDMIDVRAFLMFGGSVKCVGLSGAACVASFCISYLVMKKTYERRLA